MLQLLQLLCGHYGTGSWLSEQQRPMMLVKVWVVCCRL